MSDFKWKNIVRCAVRNLPRHNSPLTAGRSYWFAVAELCGVGSTSAIELCEMFGIDPDQKMPTQLATDDVVRCDKCGWPLAQSTEQGCVPGNCSIWGF